MKPTKAPECSSTKQNVPALWTPTLTSHPIMLHEKKKKGAFQTQPVSDTNFTHPFFYLHLWVVICIPQACNSMFFPFSSPFEHQECHFTSIPVCLVYLRTLNLILWPGKKGRQDCTLVSGRVVLGQEPSCSTKGRFPSSFPQIFPGTKVQPEGIRLLFNSSRILHLKMLSVLL